MKKNKSIFNWSGGKDSALALYHVLKNKNYNVAKLITTVNSTYNRVSMHGVRSELLIAQGEEIGLPLHKILLPETPSMEAYDSIMSNEFMQLKKEKITHSIYGDIFLEDLRAYREQKLQENGLKAHFPLWKRNTKEIVHEFIDLGFKTMVVCVKSELLDKDFTGRIIDKDFLKDLPSNVDPAGENGEFHTFVFDGPIFKKPIQFKLGEKFFKEYKNPSQNNNNSTKTNKIGFHFCDLKPL